jgi:inosine-uridine nucleoside N-ribohydrolase
MRATVLCLAAVMAMGVASARADQSQAGPVKLIFDTDIGNDADDAMALAMIHALQSRRECELLAVTVTKDNQYAGRFIDLMNTFYGRAGIPIGLVRKGVTPDDGKYLRQVVTASDGGKPRYPHDFKPGPDVPEAVALLRRVLAAQADRSVVIVQVGFCTNLARLLDSPADSSVPVPGRELVRRKVRLLSTMAGAFGEKMRGRKEYNIIMDLPAAKKLFAEWPTPVVASGWEIGAAIKHPAQSMREDYAYVAHHPLREAYHYYRGLDKDQPTYDLTSVLYAVRPDRGYFDLSTPGRITVEANGTTTFQPDPSGPHRYLIARPAQVVMVREAQSLLCSEPPK